MVVGDVAGIAVLQPSETTVLVLNGAGLKTTQRIGELMGGLPTR
jgi:hypothetical protein